jgi:hypothetical protein
MKSKKYPSLTSAQRTEAAIKRMAAKTPEQRAASMRKGWQTRRRNLGTLAVSILILCAHAALAQCPTSANSTPNFPTGGNLFGRSGPQVNAYFGAKADSNNGVLCGPSIQNLPNPVNPGDAASRQYVDNKATPIVLKNPVSVVTNGSATFTGSISGTALTVSVVSSGKIGPNQFLTGTGVTAGTQIVSGSGTSWVVSPSQTVSSAAMTSSGALPPNAYSNGTNGIGASLTGLSNGALSIDGVAVTAGMRVGVKDEISPTNNGMYVVTAPGDSSHPYVLTRAPGPPIQAEYDSSLSITPNSYFLATGGQINTSTGWLMTTQGIITVGVSPISFVQFTQATPGLGYTPLNPVNNLADVASAATARNNLIPSGTILLSQLASSVAGQIASCPNVMAYGADPTGAADNAAAWGAILAAQATNPCVYFPRGKYKFLSALTYTFPADRQAIVIKGDAPDVTELTWPNAVGTGLLINLPGLTDHVHVRDLTFSTGTNNADTGIKLVQQTAAGTPTASGEIQSDFTNLIFRSSEGVWGETGAATTHVWQNGIITQDVSFVLFNNVEAWGPSTQLTITGYASLTNSGAGITVVGTHPTGPLPVVFNFTNCNFQWLSNGILIGNLVQGITISQSNFTGNYTGIGVPPGETGLDELTVANGNQLNNIYNLNILSTVPNLIVSGNGPFIQEGAVSAVGIYYPVPSYLTTITGNTFNAGVSPVGTKGIVLNGSGSADVAPATIIGNAFVNQATAITLGAGSSGTVVSDNIYPNTSIKVVNNGSPLNVVKGLGNAFAVVGAVTNNGSGLTRLTVSSTAQFVTGEQVSISGSSYPSANVVTFITVVDGTHFDLPAVLFTGGPYSGGGIVSSMP